MHDWARFYVEPYGWLWADAVAADAFGLEA